MKCLINPGKSGEIRNWNQSDIAEDLINWWELVFDVMNPWLVEVLIKVSRNDWEGDKRDIDPKDPRVRYIVLDLGDWCMDVVKLVRVVMSEFYS